MASKGWQTEELVQADGYDVFAVQNDCPDPNAPKLLITAGIHGEEPASVIGTIDWLTRSASRWSTQIHITAIPCINPWGFVRGIRFGPHGKDLNREFDKPKHAYVQAVRDYLSGRSFDLFMDEHEDCDFYDMYAYELGPKQPVTLARRVLERCKPFVVLSHSEEVGPFSTVEGLVRPIGPEVEPGDDSHLEGLPIALWAYDNITRHTITVETPGMQSLNLRCRLHGEALDEACHYLVGVGA